MFDWIGKLFKPASKLIDELHLSGEEKLKLRNEFAKIQTEANKQFIDLAKVELETKAKIIEAEAKSSHFLQSNWRPACSILLILLIVFDSFGLVTANEGLYSLATAFLGLYGAGRSWEKATNTNKLGK